MASKTCVRCGASIDETCNFCPVCGAAVAATTLPPNGGREKPASGAQASTTPGSPTADLQRNVAGFLCYLLWFVTGILFLLIEPYNRDKFVRFHAFQSIFFFIAWVVTEVVASVVALIMGAIFPPSLDFIGQIFLSLVTLGLLFVWIFLMYKAYSNEMFRLPILGDLAAKQA
ncbi:MAG: DUF4870 domain-containing protein [Acidobacteria bacterium]|nr:DUF4870 domain-containing protein [Acidobacteriota bacterium]